MTNDTVTPIRGRSRGRVLAVFVFLALIIGLGGLHKAGYAILSSGGSSRADAGTGMAMLSCTYFTGTEMVINHIFRKPSGDEDKARCPVFTKLSPEFKAN